MKVYLDNRNGNVYIKDKNGIYPFWFEKGLTKRKIKGMLRKWGITTRKTVDKKRFGSVKLDLNEQHIEEI